MDFSGCPEAERLAIEKLKLMMDYMSASKSDFHMYEIASNCELFAMWINNRVVVGAEFKKIFFKIGLTVAGIQSDILYSSNYSDLLISQKDLGILSKLNHRIMIERQDRLFSFFNDPQFTVSSGSVVNCVVSYMRTLAGWCLHWHAADKQCKDALAAVVLDCLSLCGDVIKFSSMSSCPLAGGPSSIWIHVYGLNNTRKIQLRNEAFKLRGIIKGIQRVS
jgi:hypothetical protein